MEIFLWIRKKESDGIEGEIGEIALTVGNKILYPNYPSKLPTYISNILWINA